MYDFIIVGAGLTGSVIARILSDSGKSVLVIDRRSHLAGNIHDHRHASGINVHTYGPHYFRTNDQDLWSFVNRFADFYDYYPILKSFVEGSNENWPIAGSYIDRTVGKNWKPEFIGVPTNFEEASLSIMPKPIYETFVKGYSEKQWGVKATTLQPGLAKRFDVRDDDEPRLMRHKFQGIPKLGYTNFVQSILKGVPVLLNTNYLLHRSNFAPRSAIIFTGPIDEFFNFDLGRLLYRGQKRTHQYLPDVDFVQPVGQINNPSLNNGAHIRTLEWKHMMDPYYACRIRGTLLTQEVPFTPTNPDQYEYPFPDTKNSELYNCYRKRAESLENTIICGRLGEYKYFDMDQAIGRAMMLAQRILSNYPIESPSV